MLDGAKIDRVSMIILRAMRGPIMLLFSVYCIGIAGFSLVPGTDGTPLSFFHALYILSYTATTTGFGELPIPFSNAQRLWAILILHVSVVAWLYSIGAIISLIQNRHFRYAVSRYLFARRVSKSSDPFAIICGFGDAGSLLARGLNDQRIGVIVIDNEEDRIRALNLRNFQVRVLGVCADSSDPQVLRDAGLENPLCLGIAAVTDDDYVNMKTCVMTRALNPSITPICHIHRQTIGDELEPLHSVTMLESFDVFADRLGTALQRPSLYALGDWLVRMPGASLDYRLNCPAGRWIICGYGRMGKNMEEDLREQGEEVIVIDPDIDEDDGDESHIRGSSNQAALQKAGIESAAGVIIGTASDTVNLRIMMTVRAMNPDLFIVMRQNRYVNEIVFANAPVDLVMHPDRVISRRIQLELISPALQPLLEYLEHCPLEELEDLIERLRTAVGKELPVLWIVSLDTDTAPALDGRPSQERTISPMLKDLIRDPRDRDALVGCVPLILFRNDREYRVPDLEISLVRGDRLLFCGTRQARTSLEGTLKNPYTLEYLVSGEQPPHSYLVRGINRLRQRSA